LKRKQPNKITVQAMREFEDGKGHTVNPPKELFHELAGIDINDA